MPGPYPSPFGKPHGDGDSKSRPQDPRVLQVGAHGPVAWPTYISPGGEERRAAKGEPPRSDQEVVDAVWGRPAHLRTTWPIVGQRVWYIRHEWGDPEPATVIQVQSKQDTTDPNIWHPVFENGLPKHTVDGDEVLRMRPDPMPWVVLQADDGFVTQTWEARARGACGWLPMEGPDA